MQDRRRGGIWPMPPGVHCLSIPFVYARITFVYVQTRCNCMFSGIGGGSLGMHQYRDLPPYTFRLGKGYHKPLTYI